MEGVIVAALVAGLVSLIGLLVNLSIARKDRKANRAQAVISARILATQESMKLLHGYLTDVEKFRAEAVLLRGAIIQIEANRVSNVNDLKIQLDSFNKGLSLFFTNWSLAKSEVPDHALEVTRAYRHECKNLARNIEYLVGNILVAEENSKQIDSKTRKEAKQMTDYLLEQLDGLFTTLNNIRAQRFYEILTLGDGD